MFGCDDDLDIFDDDFLSEVFHGGGGERTPTPSNTSPTHSNHEPKSNEDLIPDDDGFGDLLEEDLGEGKQVVDYRARILKVIEGSRSNEENGEEIGFKIPFSPVTSSSNSGSSNCNSKRKVEVGHPLVQKRKFPGPAGLLPEISQGRSESPGEEVRLDTRHKDKEVIFSQTTAENYNSGAWEQMVNDLDIDPCDPSSPLCVYNVRWVVSRAGLRGGAGVKKVPFLAVKIKSVSVRGGHPMLVLKDGTGEINGTITQSVLEEYHTQLTAGAVLVLRGVTILSPLITRDRATSPARRHYLNITKQAIITIYTPREDGVQSTRVGSADFDLSGTNGSSFIIEEEEEEEGVSDDGGSRLFSHTGLSVGERSDDGTGRGNERLARVGSARLQKGVRCDIVRGQDLQSPVRHGGNVRGRAKFVGRFEAGREGDGRPFDTGIRQQGRNLGRDEERVGRLGRSEEKGGGLKMNVRQESGTEDRFGRTHGSENEGTSLDAEKYKNGGAFDSGRGRGRHDMGSGERFGRFDAMGQSENGSLDSEENGGIPNKGGGCARHDMGREDKFGRLQRTQRSGCEGGSYNIGGDINIESRRQQEGEDLRSPEQQSQTRNGPPNERPSFSARTGTNSRTRTGFSPSVQGTGGLRATPGNVKPPERSVNKPHTSTSYKPVGNSNPPASFPSSSIFSSQAEEEEINELLSSLDEESIFGDF